MLSCFCHNSKFINHCGNCLKKIRDISHCVRYPCEHGGFLGFYCDMKCLTESPPATIDEFTDLRLDNMQNTIEEFGIFDRFNK